MPEGACRERGPPSSAPRPAPPPAEGERSTAGEGCGNVLLVQQQARLQPFRTQPPESGGRAEEAGKAPQDATRHRDGRGQQRGQEAGVAILWQDDGGWREGGGRRLLQ